MTRIKICGITNIDDALCAAAAGADALGFVFAESPRRVRPEAARRIIDGLPPFLRTVGVFRDMPAEEISAIAREAGLDCIQLHGDETPEFCSRFDRIVLKRFAVYDDDTPARLQARVDGFLVAASLIDPGAGSGATFRWELARDLRPRAIVAGGLHAANVGEAIRRARPYAVDACSGFERDAGIKDHDELRAFVRAVREEDARNTAR